MNNTSTTHRSLKFDKFALVIGFIVDSITIASIIGIIKAQDSQIHLSRIITPGVAFGIWVLAFYLCIAIFHKHWKKEKAIRKYEDTFRLFLINDLIWRFRKPFLLLPIIILIILICGIVSISGVFALPILVVFILACSITLILTKEDCLSNSSLDTGKEIINGKWEVIKKRIEMELAVQIYSVSADNIKDLCPIWNISKKNLKDALIRYAAENIDAVYYDDYYGLRKRRYLF